MKEALIKTVREMIEEAHNGIVSRRIEIDESRISYVKMLVSNMTSGTDRQVRVRYDEGYLWIELKYPPYHSPLKLLSDSEVVWALKYLHEAQSKHHTLPEDLERVQAAFRPYIAPLKAKVWIRPEI